MKELLENFSIQEILMFIVLLAVAIKGAIGWYDWAKDRMNKKFEKTSEDNKEKEELRKDIDSLMESNKEILEKIDKITGKVNLLMDSDKDDIKAYITREHHYFCYTLGYIDDYNLDCIERRYSHYKEEGGNSFVADLMGEIRALPKKTIEVTPHEITSAIQKENDNK